MLIPTLPQMRACSRASLPAVMSLFSVVITIAITVAITVVITATATTSLSDQASFQLRHKLIHRETAPRLLITNVDKLNGYIAAKEFLAHFDPSPLPTRLHLTDVPGNQSRYDVHCTVSDAASVQSELAEKLGCTLHAVNENHGHQGNNISDSVVNHIQPEYLLYIPSMTHSTADIAEIYFGAVEKAAVTKKVVIWSRISAGESPDLEGLGWYADIETHARNTMVNTDWTVLRLGFGIERFLDFAPLMEDTSSLTLPIGDGSFAPVSLHDASLAAYKLFTTIKPEHKHHVYTITGPQLYTGVQLAESATKALGIPVTFANISPDEAKHMYSSIENFTPGVVRILLDVLECVRRAAHRSLDSYHHKSASICDEVSPDGRLLLGIDEPMKNMDWFWEKYSEVFRPGG